MHYDFFTLTEPTPDRAVVTLEKKLSTFLKFIIPYAKTVAYAVQKTTNIDFDGIATYLHPPEDYLLVSKHLPIFIVADGVTLEFQKDGTYPNPSGAKDAARLFCEAALAEAERLYDTFVETSLHRIFEAGNDAVGAYNEKRGRTKETSNFWDFDLFAATTAVAVLKDNTLYWSSTCDAAVAHISDDGTVQFVSPTCWPAERRDAHSATWEGLSSAEKEKLVRRVYRNNVEPDGSLIGYDVATGEEEAGKYLDTGSRPVAPGDTILIYSDGFENYIQLPEFAQIFSSNSGDEAKRALQTLTEQKSHEDPSEYGHERSLIAITIQ